MRQGNIKGLTADAAKIAEKLRKADTSLAALLKKYHVGRPTLMKVVLSQMSEAEWQQVSQRLRTGRTYKVMKAAARIARRLRKTDVTLEKLMKQYHCSYGVMTKAIRSQMSDEEWSEIRKKNLAQGGVKTRFQKGMVTWNKGLHYNPGGRSVETRFQKDHLPHNGKKLGTITIRRDKSGQYRMIALPGPTAIRHRWVYYAQYIWEQEHGPVPEGYLVVHEDGNRLNDDPGNLVLIDRGEHLALMKKNNPGWKKKAIKSYKKTVRIRHRRKAREAKKAAKIQEYELKLQRKARRLAEKEALEKSRAEAEFAKLYGPVSTWWQCAECGLDFEGEFPWKCPKCQGLRFVKITQHKKEVI